MSDAMTVTIDGQEVEIRETDNGFEAVEAAESFEDYVRENTPLFWSEEYDNSDYDLAPKPGPTLGSDLSEIINDPNIELKGVREKEGALVVDLNDER